MIETTKYADVTKKNIPITNKENYHMCEMETTAKPEVVAQLVNKMKALIQEIKTIRAVTENKPTAKKKTQTSKLLQTKRNKQKTRRTQRLPLLK